jgi:hypothetical protein
MINVYYIIQIRYKPEIFNEIIEHYQEMNNSLPYAIIEWESSKPVDNGDQNL